MTWCMSFASSMLPPCGPLRSRTRIASTIVKRRPHERRQVGDRDVDVLVQAVAAAAEHAVPVLHRRRCTSTRLWCLATGTLMTLSALTSGV